MYTKLQLALLLATVLSIQTTQCHPVHHQSRADSQQPESEPEIAQEQTDYNYPDYIGDDNQVPSKKSLASEREHNRTVEEFVNEFLELFYDRYVKEDPAQRHGEEQRHGAAVAGSARPEDGRAKTAETPTASADYDMDEMMQGDAPAPDAINPLTGSFPKMAGYNMENVNVTDGNNSMMHFRAIINKAGNRTFPITYQTDLHHMRTITKIQHLEQLKKKITKHLNRENSTKLPLEEAFQRNMLENISFNLIQQTPFQGDNQTEESNFLQKVRSYRPSCDRPTTNDHEMWNNETLMNLFFDFDHLPTNSRINIATATLRLYQIPQTNATGSGESCETTTEEEKKLLRVSIFWYFRSSNSKKPKIKRRMCDAKVVPEGASFIELNVDHPARAWSKNPSKNLGLSVQVEDQYLNILKADKYFRGTICTVGNPQTKPIPHIFQDAVLAGVQNGSHDVSAAQSINELLLPSIDVCTIEIPENTTLSPHHATSYNSKCGITKLNSETKNIINTVNWERLAMNQANKMSINGHHIRHQRNHNADGSRGGGVDPRNKIQNKIVVFTKAELDNFNNSTSSTASTTQKGSVNR